MSPVHFRDDRRTGGSGSYMMDPRAKAKERTGDYDLPGGSGYAATEYDEDDRERLKYAAERAFGRSKGYDDTGDGPGRGRGGGRGSGRGREHQQHERSHYGDEWDDGRRDYQGKGYQGYDNHYSGGWDQGKGNRGYNNGYQNGGGGGGGKGNQGYNNGYQDGGGGGGGGKGYNNGYQNGGGGGGGGNSLDSFDPFSDCFDPDGSNLGQANPVAVTPAHGAVGACRASQMQRERLPAHAALSTGYLDGVCIRHTNTNPRLYHTNPTLSQSGPAT